MRDRMRRGGIAVTVMALSTNVLLAAPAPASTNCTGTVNWPAHEVGVGGQPVATVPGFSVSACVTAPDNLPSPPSLDFSLSNGWTFQLVHPDAGGGQVSVTITYSVAGSGDTRTVTLPVPLNGGRTCLFFWGPTSANPGGCLVFLNN